jgi:two-component system chemotaxis sensor kinase CheA
MTTPDPEVLELAREEANERLERIERNLLALEAGAAAPDVIDELFRDAHSIKGAAGMVGWHDALAIARVMEDRLSECRSSGAFHSELTDPLLRATDALRQTVAGESAPVSNVVADLEDLARSDGDGDGTVDDRADEPVSGNGEPAGVAATPADGAASPMRRSIRIGAEKVDRMLDAVGETVLHHRRLEHVLAERAAESRDETAEEELDFGERLLSELQDSVIGMRTVPLSSITAPFPRAVRDLAAAEGKDVELAIVGAETQLDRAILEGLSDVITHLLRNAVAHGVEEPDERERAGKPRQGRVELRAEQREGMVAIEVADDGRGVPPELLERAGHIGSLVDVLATAGFSTAEEVSDVAGRGVGLDAVKNHVEALGGSLDVRSEPGRGTEAIMLLPLTLALMAVLMCERAGQVFGLPLASVREVISVAETISLGGKPSIELRGESTPVADLATMLGGAAPQLPDRPPAMMLASAGRRVAVACDAVLGDHEVVIKSLGPLLDGVRGYLGAAILGDGRIALILDPSHLLKIPSGRVPTPRRLAEVQEDRVPMVLVVDDQFTVRELQRSILETAGYRVELARHGREALDRISSTTDIDLVVTDLQMPEMDGIELLQSIRKHPEHSALPVVIITALGGDEDRRRGVEEGADAYIAKDEFDQQALLDTIERLVGR